MSEEIEREDLRTRWRALEAEKTVLEEQTRLVTGTGDARALHAHAERLHEFHQRLHKLTLDLDAFHTTHGHPVMLPD